MPTVQEIIDQVRRNGQPAGLPPLSTGGTKGIPLAPPLEGGNPSSSPQMPPTTPEHTESVRPPSVQAIIDDIVAVDEEKQRLEISEMMTLAIKKFPSSFWKNLKASVDPRNVPGILRFLGDALFLDSPFLMLRPTREETAEEVARRFRESTVTQLAEFYMTTYDMSSEDGRERLKRYIAEDPSGFLSDAALLMGPAMGVAAKTGRIAPIIARLNANKYLRFAGTTGEILVDPSKVSDIGLKLGGRFIEEIPAMVSERPETRQDMLRLQEQFRDELPRGLPESVLSEDPRLTSREAERIKLGIFAGARQRLREMEEGLKRITDRRLAEFGGAKDIGVAGDAIFKGFREAQETAQAAERSLFRQVLGDIGQVPGNFSNTFAAIEQIKKDHPGFVTLEHPDIRALDALREKLENPTQAITLSFIDDTRTGYREIGKLPQRADLPAIVPVSKTFRMQIYDALTEDLYTSAEAASPEHAALLRRAKKTAYDTRRRFNSEYGDKIIELGMEGRYSELVDDLLKERFMTREIIPELLDTIGAEGANAIRSRYLEAILDKAKTPAGKFSPNGLIKQLENRDRVAIEAMLGAGVTQELHDIAKIMQISESLYKTLGGSQTAWNLWAMDKSLGILAGGGLETLVDVLFGRNALPATETVAAGLLVAFGREGYRAFLDSEFSRRWRLEGHDFPPNLAEKLEKAGQFIQKTPRIVTRTGGAISRMQQQGQIIQE